MKKDLVQVYVKGLTRFSNLGAELFAYTFDHIFAIKVFKDDFWIKDHHNVCGYVVKNGLELFLLLTNHLLVKK